MSTSVCRAQNEHKGGGTVSVCFLGDLPKLLFKWTTTSKHASLTPTGQSHQSHLTGRSPEAVLFQLLTLNFNPFKSDLQFYLHNNNFLSAPQPSVAATPYLSTSDCHFSTIQRFSHTLILTFLHILQNNHTLQIYQAKRFALQNFTFMGWGNFDSITQSKNTTGLSDGPKQLFCLYGIYSEFKVATVYVTTRYVRTDNFA